MATGRIRATLTQPKIWQTFRNTAQALTIGLGSATFPAKGVTPRPAQNENGAVPARFKCRS
ncbi:hypothetical protein AMTR_s00061p00216690 [Amborella trichopoda]|uniref:Uncharacterized protein n=1 Tax=Amborella trichopoda TaxID=13333 RepID=U5DCX0_AMBTC|nr:hypothetical protein AMTR_s00061p00216690 [Amborella trichopoda]